MARLRECGSLQYAYEPLIDTFGSELACRTLAVSHHTVFAEWIALPLAKQKSDLAEFLKGICVPVEDNSYRELPPPTAHDVERQLYLTDLETLLELLRWERDAASATRTASPLR